MKTNEFSLKLITTSESEDFFNLIQNNKARLEDFFAGTVSKTLSLSATKEYCQRIEEKTANKAYYPYLIIQNETNLPVGLVDIKNIDWNIPKGELGAFIDKDFEGKGLMTHFSTLVMDKIIKEHQFKKIYCRVAPHNARSCKLVERLGFKLEGTILRDYKTTKGELVDLNYYGILYD